MFINSDYNGYINALLNTPLTPTSLLRIEAILKSQNEMKLLACPTILIKLYCMTQNYPLLVATLNELYTTSLQLSHESAVLVLDTLAMLHSKLSDSDKIKNESSEKDLINIIPIDTTSLSKFITYLSVDTNNNDPELYNALLHILCVNGHIQHAYTLKHAIAPKTVKRNIKEMNILLQGYLNSNDEKGAMILMQVINESDQNENIDTLNILLTHYVKQEKYDYATTIHNTLINSDRVEPNLQTYHTLLLWKSQIGEYKECIELIQSLIKKEIIIDFNDDYLKYIPFALVKSGNKDQAIEMFSKSINENYQSRDYSQTLCFLVNALNETPGFESVEKVYQLVNGNQEFCIDRHMFDLVFLKSFLMQSNLTSALECVERIIKSDSFPPIEYVYSLFHLHLLDTQSNLQLQNVMFLLNVYKGHAYVGKSIADLIIKQIRYNESVLAVTDLNATFSEISDELFLSSEDYTRILETIERLPLQSSVENIESLLLRINI